MACQRPPPSCPKSRHPNPSSPSPPSLREVTDTCDHVPISLGCGHFRGGEGKRHPHQMGIRCRRTRTPQPRSILWSSVLRGHRGTRPGGFPSKDQQSRSSRCLPGSSTKGCNATLPNGSWVLHEPHPQLSWPPLPNATPAMRPARGGACKAWQHPGTMAKCYALEPEA